jgi:hypothetical protein
VAWRGVAWRGVAWRGVAWRGVAWRGVGRCAECRRVSPPAAAAAGGWQLGWQLVAASFASTHLFDVAMFRRLDQNLVQLVVLAAGVLFRLVLLGLRDCLARCRPRCLARCRVELGLFCGGLGDALACDAGASSGRRSGGQVRRVQVRRGGPGRGRTAASWLGCALRRRLGYVQLPGSRAASDERARRGATGRPPRHLRHDKGTRTPASTHPPPPLAPACAAACSGVLRAACGSSRRAGGSALRAAGRSTSARPSSARSTRSPAGTAVGMPRHGGRSALAAAGQRHPCGAHLVAALRARCRVWSCSAAVSRRLKWLLNMWRLKNAARALALRPVSSARSCSPPPPGSIGAGCVRSGRSGAGASADARRLPAGRRARPRHGQWHARGRAGCWLPGCWLFAPGCWLLSPGCWLVAVAWRRSGTSTELLRRSRREPGAGRLQCRQLPASAGTLAATQERAAAPSGTASAFAIAAAALARVALEFRARPPELAPCPPGADSTLLFLLIATLH